MFNWQSTVASGYIACSLDLIEDVGLMVPGEGFEPPAFGLQNRCSTAELTRLARLSKIAMDGSRGKRGTSGQQFGQANGREARPI